jgi:DNA-binding CsgD family transcriptional regulator
MAHERRGLFVDLDAAAPSAARLSLEDVKRETDLWPRAVREAFWGADWWMLFSQTLPRHQISDAATRLARDPEFLSCRFADPRADRQVRELVKVQGRARIHGYIRDQIFPTALLLAAVEARRPREIRLGRDWAKTHRGHVIRTAPIKGLPISALKAWLRQEAKRIAAEDIRNGALNHLGPFDAADSLLVDYEPAKDLLPLLDGPASLETLPPTKWRRLRARLSPRELELALLLRRRASRAEAAEALRMHPSTVKTLYRRISKKLSLLQ